MESTLFKYILRYSRKRQIVLVLVSFASFPFLYYSYQLPKMIVNEAIGGQDFPREIFSTEFEQIPFLVLLCGIFLSLVLINGVFKYFINVYRGKLGERMLRRLRYLLYSRVLRFPLPHFRKTSQGELISMITAEVEPLGGFIGDSIALPVFQGGTLITLLAFMFVQDWILGIAAVALYPVQMVMIPRMQKRVNILAKERVRTVRALSERIGESVSGMEEIRAHDMSEYALADFSARIGKIYDIRYQIFVRKFLIKFLNNFIAMVTPFLFYLIGGYLVIKGDLTFGALVAILGAYKDLSSPWKELLRYYQQKEDARIKYEQLIEQFQPAGMLDEDLQRNEPETIPALTGPIIATNLSVEEDGGIKVLEGVSFTMEPSLKTAIVGRGGSGRSALVQLLARLTNPDTGSISISDYNLKNLPEPVTGRRLAYVGPDSYVFSGTVRDNLLYGLKHRPGIPAQYDEEGQRQHREFVIEAEEAGNTTSDINADWIDYAAIGAAGQEDLFGHINKALMAVDLHEDIYELGLGGALDPALEPELAERILETRRRLHGRLADPAYSDLVETFDREKYNTNMSVAENLLFGTPIGADFDLDRLGLNRHVLAALDRVGLTKDFLATGARLAAIMVELFQDLPPGHQFFQQYGFISSDDLPEYQQISRRAESVGIDELDEAERTMLMSLPFKLIPARHRIGLIDKEMQVRLLEARRVFADTLPDGVKGSVAFFDRQEYNAAASIQDNILFGRLVYGRPQSHREIGRLIGEVVEEQGLRQAIMGVGLDAPVGIAGSRLSPGQRQKLALARCLMKNADILIVNEAIAGLDPTSQSKIMKNVFEFVGGRGLVWVLNRADLARHFDRAMVMEGGKMLEHGPPEELNQPGRPLHDLVE